jgi:D-alanyl-D-alanine carboxypeptidase
MKQHLLAVLTLIAINGCGAYAGTQSDDPAGTASGSGGAKNGGSTVPAAGGGPATPDPSSPLCLAQASSLQTVLDRLSKLDGDSNMTLGVATPQCGKQVIVSGNLSEVTVTSLHRIGSVTKTFVSALILTLVQNNRLALTDTLLKYFPSSEIPNASTITVHQMLNQTSGIYNYMGDDDYKSNPKRKWMPADLVALAASHDAVSSPGTTFHFSDTNYILLGMIAEMVGGGGSIAQQIRTNLLDPAGLSSTFFDGPETLVGTLAPGFDWDTSANTTYARDPSSWWAAAAMVSTPSDLLDWTAGLYGNALLGASTVTTMVDSGGTKMGGDDTTYGLGVIEYPAAAGGNGGASLGHDSSLTGYSTQASYFADKQTSIVAMVDEDSGDTDVMILGALQVLFPM